MPPEAGPSLRYAADVSGIIHLIIDYRPGREPAYIAQCGQRVDARRAEVFREREAPGVLCRQCAAMRADATSD